MKVLDYNVEQIIRGQLLAHRVIYLLRRGAAAVQAERGLVVDGAAGPLTRAAIDELLALIDAALQAKARGVIADPEAPFIGRHADANELMAHLLAEAAKHGLSVGATSYGAPWHFGGFPWKSFTGAHFGMPQIYDANNNLGPEYPKQSIDAWKEKGFQRIIPVSAAFNKDSQQMCALLAATPAEAALCWWDWFNCSLDSVRWDMVDAYSLPLQG